MDNINNEITSDTKAAVDSIVSVYTSQSRRTGDNLKLYQGKLRSYFKSYGALLIHSIYVADNSSHNEFRNNIFQNFSGDPLRIRNASNHNLITKNTFKDAFISERRKNSAVLSKNIFAVSEWHCNTGVLDCLVGTKRVEDRSFGTVISGNNYSAIAGIYAYQNQLLADSPDSSQTIVPSCKLDELCMPNDDEKIVVIEKNYNRY